MIVHAMQLVSLCVQFWKSVARAMHNVEELWQWKQKVKDLRNKEQKHRFAKMAKNSHDGEGHARKIAESITDKDFGRVSILFQ